MKVKELMEILSKENPETDIILFDGDFQNIAVYEQKFYAYYDTTYNYLSVSHKDFMKYFSHKILCGEKGAILIDTDGRYYPFSEKEQDRFRTLSQAFM